MKTLSQHVRSPDTLSQSVSIGSWLDTMRAFQMSYSELDQHSSNLAHSSTIQAEKDSISQLLIVMRTELTLLGSQPVTTFGQAALTAYTVHLRFLTIQAISIVSQAEHINN